MPRPLESSEPIELPPELKWHYTKIGACMMRGPYMLAAPPLGFECHHPVNRTFPCYKLLKGCTLDCPFCRWKKQFTVYVPLFDLQERTRFKMVIAGGKKTFQDVRSLAVGSVLALSRGENSRETIRVRAWPEVIAEREYRTWKARCVDDITPYLFHLWQRRELTEHFGHTYWPSRAIISNAAAMPELTAEDVDKIPK